jgi:plastocyanin
MRKLVASLALFALACGGGEQGAQEEAQAAAQPSQPAAPAAQPAGGGTGTVHTVEMLLTNDGQYVYRPASLTIRVGDTVRWLNVSGFPHNVAFYQDQIPQGAAQFLSAAMPAEGKLGPMSGRLMTQPNETYEITFSGAPTGTYNYFCTPHEALGMKGTLTIQP